MASRSFVTVHCFAVQDEDDEAYLRSFDSAAAAGDTAEDGTSLDGSNSSCEDDGDYSEDDGEYAEGEEDDDDDYDEEGSDYEDDDGEDEAGAPSITPGGNLRHDTDLDCSKKEGHSFEGGCAGEESNNARDNVCRRNSYGEQPTELTSSCSWIDVLHSK